MTDTVLPEGYDFSDPDILWESVPHEQFQALRLNAPVYWVEQPQSSRDGMAEAAGTGYWAVSKHAEVAAVSKDSKNFSSSENGAIIRFQEGMLREMVEMQRVMLLNQDPPEHTATRHIISRMFTPRAIGALEEIMRERARRIVLDAVERGSGNFVEEVAAELPLQAIADLLGVPQEDRRKLFDWSNQMLANEDPDFEGASDVAAAEILGYAMAMAAERKENPRDDLVTRLLNADKDGRGLNDDEFGYFVIMLTVAGNETTRNAITHGMDAFLDHPDQWELWLDERPDDHGRRGDPVGDPDQRLPANRAQRRRGGRRAGARRASGSGCSTAAPTTTTTSSRSPTPSTSPARRTPTWPSAGTARTTASAPTWPARRSG